MEKLLSVAEMQFIEQEANDQGLSFDTMMENAGNSVALFINHAFGKVYPCAVIALVGSGNNGGDALVALCKLRELGWQTCAYIVKSRHKGDTRLQQYVRLGGDVFLCEDDKGWIHLDKYLSQSSVLIDGILGTGVRLPLPTKTSGVLAYAKQFVQERHGSIHVVAVDCPSGVDCDTGAAAPDVIPAEVTITMAAIKRGLITFPAADLVGEIRVGDIGNICDLDAYNAIKRSVLTGIDISQSLPFRPRNAHKGTFGTVLMVLGSGNYPGAVLLAGMGAYRIGAGLVKIAVPELIYSALVGELKEATWVRIPHAEGWISEDASRIVLDALIGVNALLLGPGFGLEKTTGVFMEEIIVADLPNTVIDADGLKLLASIPEWHSILHGEVIITPHPGEMAVLTGLSIEEIQSNRLEVAESFARQWDKVIVLKGAYTVIADPGGYTAVVPVATPALARAGTGDVLAGIIVGLLAQGLSTFQAAFTGAYIHALAGLEAENVQGNSASVLAGDVLNMISRILTRYQ
jgi:hydroxyethylthiazole kinase-like uncharacterized protein yjeF